MMKIQKAVTTLVIALFTAVSVQTVAFAKAKDDDSVRSWGPWATLVKPAAGPQTPTPLFFSTLNTPGFGSGDAQSFTPTVVDACAAGAACGYAAIAQVAAFFSRDEDEESLNIVGPQLATPNVNPIPLSEFFAQREDNVMATKFRELEPVNLSITSNSSSLAINMVDAEVRPFKLSIPELSPLNARPHPTIRAAFWQAMVEDFDGGDDFKSALVQIALGVTFDAIDSLFTYGYVAENSRFSSRDKSGELSFTIAPFVFGQTTELETLNELAGFSGRESIATYHGFTMLSGGEVEIGVDFGEGTWEGGFNFGGGDVIPVENSDGSTSLIGNVGFAAGGVIDGVNIVATEIESFDEGVDIAGEVTGSFFGGEADILAGGIDVDLSSEKVGSANYVDVFVTAEESFGELPQIIPGGAQGGVVLPIGIIVGPQ